MSTMYIREFPDSGAYQSGSTLPVEGNSTDQHITFTGTAGQSAALQNNTRAVRITVDGIASILFGTNPTAVANTNYRMTAGSVYECLVPVGSALKISAVTST